MTGSETAARDELLREDAELTRLLREQGPMNLERAFEVMDEFDLKGLVLGEPVNVFHVLGYWPQLGNTRMGQPPTTFALLSRDARQKPGLVASRFIYYYTYVDGGFANDVQVYLYQEADDNTQSEALLPPDMLGPEFPDRKQAPLSSVELRRRQALNAVTAASGTSADTGAALVRAMKEMGLWQGRIACDHVVTEAVCERHGHPGDVLPGDNILRWIRLVKSPLEIRLMRRAAIANVDAVTAVGHAVRAGASHAELQHLFEVEAARLGNRALFLNVDRVSSELSDGVISDGQAFFIDGVSHSHHYHGDYARTVFVGEPVHAARKAAQAVAHAWQSIRERLRPGMRYSDIVALGQEAVRKGGFDVAVGIGPHSVGLMHTDEPGRDAGGFYGKLDLTLRESMILSVDCPVMNTGVGGSAHIEDLMLITTEGAAPLHDIGDPVITV
ncbi:MAG: M24 family metallopeptidase [Gammaproteobacteria bacterium]|nr:M24 family metallopeptidase [Gammaproteobacteria bacterium]